MLPWRLEFFRRAAGSPARLAVLSAAFNPPTRAHLALAAASLDHADETLLVLPRVFPHKSYEGPGFKDRLRLVQDAVAHEPRFSVAASERGLFAEIADELAGAYGASTRVLFVCGRDAAERIVHWDYGEAGAFQKMLDRFELLVAARGGEYSPPPEMRTRIHPLRLAEDYDSISATEVRRRIRAGVPWEHLVPESIVARVRELYAA
jgi:nicotinate-nucleotide adenylyltransferase